MKENASLERKEKETTANYLKRLKDMGFLFHGSNNKHITELEPRYTFDRNNEENTDTAVFATNNITWTTIFGVYGGNKGWSTSIKDGLVTANIPLRDKVLVDTTTGNVYVLPVETFKPSETGQQYKSHVTVKPVQKVEVTVKDFYDLGGKIKWVYSFALLAISVSTNLTSLPYVCLLISRIMVASFSLRFLSRSMMSLLSFIENWGTGSFLTRVRM